MLKTTEEEIEEVREYFEWQAPDLEVIFMQKVYSEAVLNTRHDVWRDYDAEDSVRFYALRMKETGMIKSSPQEVIANGTDFRFVEELKRELKT